MGPLANDPQQASAANGYRSPHIAIGPPIDIESNVTDCRVTCPVGSGVSLGGDLGGTDPFRSWTRCSMARCRSPSRLPRAHTNGPSTAALRGLRGIRRRSISALSSGVSTSNPDNSTAINNALSTLGPLGVEAYLPFPCVGNFYAIQNPIIIGNGSSSAFSTWSGMLAGGGMPGGTSVTNEAATIESKIKWSGAAGFADAMVQVIGSLTGWGIRNLRLDDGVLSPPRGTPRRPLCTQLRPLAGPWTTCRSPAASPVCITTP